MKKKLLITASMIAVMALSAVGFTACNGSTSDNSSSSVETPADNKVTVTYYDGTNELKTEEIAKGGKAVSWTPEKTGYEFMGWYAEASLGIAFDFDTALTEDTDIFSAWRSSTYVEDSNVYYLVGAGSGDMMASNWKVDAPVSNLTFTKDTTVTNKNVYTVQIKMYAGDKFQIVYGGTWDHQQGIGHMTGFEYAAGINPCAPAVGEVTAADRKYGEVKDAEGNLIFYGGDEYNKGAEVWNVWLAEGQDGIYEFTYTTYPSNPSYNTIDWKLVEKVAPLTSTHDMAFTGTMNEWAKTADVLADWKLTKSEDGKTWTGFITVTEAMYADWTEGDSANTLGVKCAALKIYNIVNSDYIGINGQNIFVTAGTYCFKYTVETNTVEFQELAYYVVGTFLEGNNAVNFAVKEGVTPELTVDGTTATATLTAVDVTANNAYTWMTSQGKPGVMAVKVVYGCEFGIKDWYSDNANGGDNFYLTAGQHTITLDIATGTVTVA